MKRNLLALAAASALITGAQAASSANMAGQLSFQLTDLDLTDGITPSMAMPGQGGTANAWVGGFEWVSSEFCFSVPPQGTRCAAGQPRGDKTFVEVNRTADWNLEAVGYETGRGDGPMSFFGRIGFGGYTGLISLSPHSALTITQTFYGNLTTQPYLSRPAYAKAEAFLDVFALPTIGGPATMYSSSEAHFELLPQVVWSSGWNTMYASRELVIGPQELRVSISNSSDEQLTVGYDARLQILGVTAVPEPGTWALMLVGAASVFTSVKRRQRQARPRPPQPLPADAAPAGALRSAR